MSFEKLSSTEEKKVFRLIEKAIYYSRSGMGPTDAMIKAASEANTTPELLKRSCEAFNKSKSVYMLSKVASDRRAEPFDLIDINKVLDSVYYNKEASIKTESTLKIPNKDYSNLGLPVITKSFEKSASAKSNTPYDRSFFEYRKNLTDRRSASYMQKHAESQLKQVRLESEKYLDQAIDVMSRTEKPELEKVAKLICNKFGSDGIQLMKIASAKLNTNFKIEKTAYHAVFPYKEPYISLTKAIEKAEEYRSLKKKINFTKKADLEEALPVAVASVANPAISAASSVVELSKVPVIDYLTRAGTKDYGNKEVNKVLDPVFFNQLRAIDATQNFLDIAGDPALKSYSLNQIADAYNAITGTMPELQKPRFKSWLTALVRKQLIQGNVVDPNEIPTLGTLAYNLSRVRDYRLSSDIKQSTFLAERASKRQALPASLIAAISGIQPSYIKAQISGSGHESVPTPPIDVDAIKGLDANDLKFLHHLGVIHPKPGNAGHVSYSSIDYFDFSKDLYKVLDGLQALQIYKELHK